MAVNAKSLPALPRFVRAKDGTFDAFKTRKTGPPLGISIGMRNAASEKKLSLPL
jgi:hypothetical protein